MLVLVIFLLQGAKVNCQNNDFPKAPTTNAPDRTNDLNRTSEATQNQKQVLAQSVSVTSDVRVKRDWYDKAFIVFTALLALVTGFQGILLFWTYVADHRPRLEVSHVGLLTEPDAIFAADSAGHTVPIDTVIVVVNRGGSRAKVVDANITTKVIGGAGGLEDFLARRPPLPQFDRKTGLPMYETSGEVVLKKRTVSGAERRVLKITMAMQNPVAEQVRVYLATHPDRHVKSLALLVFGYLTYRDWKGRSYTTSFCRRYDPSDQRFVVVENPDYERTE
jgi:hypothetical protein